MARGLWQRSLSDSGQVVPSGPRPKGGMHAGGFPNHPAWRGSQWHFKAQDHVLTTAEKVAPVPVLARPLPRCPLRASVERQSKEKLGEAGPGGTGSVHSPREQAGGCRGWAWAVDPGPWGEAGA